MKASTSFGPARQETGRFGCHEVGLRLNFVAVCLDEPKIALDGRNREMSDQVPWGSIRNCR